MSAGIAIAAGVIACVGCVNLAPPVGGAFCQGGAGCPDAAAFDTARPAFDASAVVVPGADGGTDKGAADLAPTDAASDQSTVADGAAPTDAVPGPDPDPCPAPCPAAFYDGFESGTADRWTVRSGPTGDFTVVRDGSYVYREQSQSVVWHVSTADAPRLNTTVRARLKVQEFGGDHHAGVYARYDIDNQTGYYASLRLSGAVSLERKDGASTTILATATPATPIAINVWRTVRLVVQGSNLSAYVDGALVVTATDTTYTSPGLSGVGGDGALFEVDDVIVTSP